VFKKDIFIKDYNVMDPGDTNMMLPWSLGGWGFMGVGMLIVGVLIIIGTYFLFTEFARPRRYQYNDALDIARQRYARGDISQEEFERIKRTL
jgi:putative membrane protein